MPNRTITCVQCGTEFEFTTKDQFRYSKMKFDDPKRCPDCRKNKSRINGFEDENRKLREKSDRNHIDN